MLGILVQILKMWNVFELILILNVGTYEACIAV